MAFKLSFLWSFDGEINRRHYFYSGIGLFLLKYNLDRLVALANGVDWSPFSYWRPDLSWGYPHYAQGQVKLVRELVLLALPFIWLGLLLTVKRLCSIGLPPWMVMLFFVPFVNLIFFFLLCILPGQSADPQRLGTMRARTADVVPKNDAGAIAAGVLVCTVITVALASLSASVFANYGFGLFLGLPFINGLTCALILNFHRDQGFGKTIGVALLSLALAGSTLFFWAIEGLVCLLMALPIAIPFAIVGAWVGWILQRSAICRLQSPQVLGVLLLFLPAMMGLEHAAKLPPEPFEVESTVDINAPPETVWMNVVSFPELAPPTELLFKTGVAYPIRAEIKGSGVGAVRYCTFSTGSFVEPIQIWDEPHRLKFGVSEQPAVMQEFSYKKDLVPPHVSNHYLRSQAGEFLLERLPDGRTRLHGTSWYTLKFWPTQYWRLWSDGIIYRIHLRVLKHVKRLSEQPKLQY